jgi:di/tricarboxylate transporter
MMTMPSIPNEHAIAALLLTVIALYLFSREQTPLETSSLGIIVILTLGFVIFPFTNSQGVELNPVIFFRGFGHEALIAVSALMVVGYGLIRTGALEPVGRILSRAWALSPALSVLLTLIVAAMLSAFVNNTPIVILFLPILISVSIRTKTAASSLLMPMGFATILGGMLTTIGTSTNLLVVSVAADAGLEPIGMFDFFIPGLIVAGVGIVYLWLIAPRLLPERKTAMSDTSPRVFTAHLSIPEGCFADNKTVHEIIEKTDGRMKIDRIRKSEQTYSFPLPDVKVRAGDQLLVRDTPTNLKEYETLLGGNLYSHGNIVDEEHPLKEDDQQIAELILDRGSPLVHRTLNELRFADTYQLSIIAIHRKGRVMEKMPSGIGHVLLRLGDVLLIQGSRENIEAIKQRGQFLVLDATVELPHTHLANRSMIIMGAVIFVAAMGFAPIAISAVCGALLMILTNCLRWRDISRALSTQVILIVVASLALGTALTSTGATGYLASCFVALTEGFSPHLIFGSLVFLMASLTNIVSNNAAAVIGTPIAISIANQLGLPPEAFVLAVLFGANMSFATPMAYQTNLLVMNAAGYTFGDFVRVGLPMTILLCGVVTWVLPAIYGF